MKRQSAGITLLVLSVLTLSACATTSARDADEPSAGPTVPAQVDGERWDGVVGAPVIEANVTGPITLEAMAAQSELAVVARVADQGPFPDHDWIATESTLEIIEILKGELVGQSPRLYTIGKPVYLEGHYDVEGVADPPLFDETYVLFLARYPEVPNAESELASVDNVWVALGHGAYMEEEDGWFHWNGEGEFSPMTLERLRDALAG